MRTLDIFFKNTETLSLPQQLQLSPSPTSPSPQNLDPFSIDNLHIRLKEID